MSDTSGQMVGRKGKARWGGGGSERRNPRLMFNMSSACIFLSFSWFFPSFFCCLSELCPRGCKCTVLSAWPSPTSVCLFICRCSDGLDRCPAQSSLSSPLPPPPKKISFTLSFSVFQLKAPLHDGVEAIQGLVGRVLGADAVGRFAYEAIPYDLVSGHDVYEIENVGGVLTLRGSSGMLMAFCCECAHGPMLNSLPLHPPTSLSYFSRPASICKSVAFDYFPVAFFFSFPRATPTPALFRFIPQTPTCYLVHILSSSVASHRVSHVSSQALLLPRACTGICATCATRRRRGVSMALATTSLCLHSCPCLPSSFARSRRCDTLWRIAEEREKYKGRLGSGREGVAASSENGHSTLACTCQDMRHTGDLVNLLIFLSALP